MVRDDAILAVSLSPACEALRLAECPDEHRLDLARTVVDTAHAGGMFYEEMRWRPEAAVQRTRELWTEVEQALGGGNVATQGAQP